MKHQFKNKQEKRLQFYVNQQEFKAVLAEFEASGFQSMSAYLRKKVAGNGIIIPYPRELQNKLDQLGIQQKRNGNNINQIAKKVHLYDLKGVFSAEMIVAFRKTMIDYQAVLNELAKAYKALISKFS